MKSEVLKKKAGKGDELLTRIFDAAARIKEQKVKSLTPEEQHAIFHTRIAKCIEADVEFLELTVKCNKLAISV
jgi:hypothetical protein